MLRREDIRIRDPFIVTDREAGCYYMYGTTAMLAGSIAASSSFRAFRSEDLEHFEGPYTVFDGEKAGFWADRDYWAPEVHRYRGKYYMFASFKAEGRCRGTQILVSDTPLGTFAPISEGPQTPADWECLDGTLLVQDGVPYLVFSHEWLQIYDGEICAVRLSEDLTRPVGEPFTLFRASDNPAVLSHSARDGHKCYVTDGPFFVPGEQGLRLLWSSMAANGYAILEATAPALTGPWEHKPPRYDFDGGHCMTFTDLSGKRRLSFHAPNTAGLERAAFADFA